MSEKEREESTRASASAEGKPSSPLGERAWTFIIIGLVLLVAALSYIWRQPSAGSPRLAEAPRLSSAMVPLATGDEPIAQLFSQAGCVVCHTIPGIPGAEGRVGPKLVLGNTGSARLADAGYRGQAKTVREYIVESILAPGVYVVPGYPDGMMPQWYGQKLSAGALDKITEYLERVIEGGASQKSEISR